MDYKYIEQLMERFWQCETSLQEEEILRSFFAQDDIPADLLKYKPIFYYEKHQKETESLTNDFDDRILAKIKDAQPVKAKRVTMNKRFMPLFKAAAVVAIVITLGNAVKTGLIQKETPSNRYEVIGIKNNNDRLSVAKADTVKTDTINQEAAKSPLQTIVK